MSTARRRLTGLATSALLLGLALAATAVVVGVGDRYNARLDVTTTGEQRLAPRTLAVLDRAAPLGEVEIVVAVDAASLDAWSRRTVGDVLDLFSHAGRVRAGEIDVGSAEGQAEYAGLLDRLIERERDGIDRHIAAVQRASAEATSVADSLEAQISPALLALRDSEPTTTPAALEQWATLARLGARQLAEAGARAQSALTEPDPTLPIPPLADHEAALRNALQLRADELEALLAELGALGPTAEPLGRAVRGLSDRLVREIDALSRLPRLDVLRVAKALGSAEVALVIGPPGTGVTGVDIGALYEPSVLASDGTRLISDVRFQAEELLGSAVSAVLSTARPIVVLTHGEGRPILKSVGFLSGIRQRLSRRGIDVVEWVASHDPEPPTLTDLDPDGVRPVVYVALSPDSSASARGEGDLSGPERAGALGRAVALLLERREALLVSVNPSILPSYGEADPVVAPLAQSGIEVATDTPLLQRSADARTRRTFTDLTLRGAEGGHAILAATRNLPTTLSWTIPITVRDGAPWRTTPLLIAPDDTSVWGESQWLRLWQTRGEQRDLLPDQPVFDAGVDRRGGPWTVALAAERADQPESTRSGRLVVVGSNAWFADPVAFKYRSTDNRVALASPGNAELFEAAVLWLAGEDELIAQSAGARATPLVGSINPGALTALRWALVAGLPALTLVVGVVWRAARG